MIVLIFVMLLCLSLSVLYATGFIPGTGRHVVKATKLKKLDEMNPDDIQDICKTYGELDMKRVESARGKTYFTFTGMKSIDELIEHKDRFEILDGADKMCQGVEDGEYVDEDVFLAKLKEIGVSDEEPEKNCLAYIMLPIKGVIKNGDIVQTSEILKQYYPKFAEKVGSCRE